MTLPHMCRVGAAVLFTAVVLAAGSAEARFGKRSKPAEQEEQAEKPSRAPTKHVVVVRESRPARTHAASAVGTEPEQCCAEPVVRPVYVNTYSPRPVWWVAPTYTHVTRNEVYSPQPRDEGPSLHRFELLTSAQPMLNGLVLSGQVRVDGRRWGMDARYDHLSLLADDGSLAIDTLHLADGSLTFALLATESVRARAHLGLHAAVAPDVTFVGPGGGLSLSAELPGPFTFETGSNLVLIPYTKVDAHAALGLRLGIFEARGGLRLTFLDDQGRLDGVSHKDLMVGPYLGMALVL